MSSQKIILNMITNEDDPKIVKRCLESVKPLIDAWVICDNGSTQEVKDAICESFQDVPGRIYSCDWIDFGTNRTEAIAIARQFALDYLPGESCYLFTLDADEELILTPDYILPDFEGLPLLGFIMKLGTVYYPRPNFLSLEHQWRFEDPQHEELICETQGIKAKLLPGPYILVKQEGKRSKDPCRYWKDSETLREAYAKNPKPRFLFYRAQALRGAGMKQACLEEYRKCIEANANPEEVWYSKLCVARLLDEAQAPESEIVMAYLDAHNSRPWRLEALASLTLYWRRLEKHELAFWACERARQIIPSGDTFFAESIWYEGPLEEEFSRNAFLSGHYPEVVEACRNLLNLPNLPDDERKRISKNMIKALDTIEKMKEAT
jgi:tetratricopeptide (TPR) repeat protein